MRRTCIICQREQILAREIDGNIVLLDPEPSPDGQLVVQGDLNDEPRALWGVDPEGDEFFGIPAGAPRYRRHDCEH